jgi:NAD+ diphosphatase
MYSIIAGFVEPGESLEGCVVREVLEEAGLQVTAPPVYYGSQPWPFPHQLMIGYLVEANSTDPVRPDMDELDEAHWFRAGELPALPPRLSLSRQLIEYWRTLATS